MLALLIVVAMSASPEDQDTFNAMGRYERDKLYKSAVRLGIDKAAEAAKVSPDVVRMAVDENNSRWIEQQAKKHRARAEFYRQWKSMSAEERKYVDEHRETVVQGFELLLEAKEKELREMIRKKEKDKDKIREARERIDDYKEALQGIKELRPYPFQLDIENPREGNFGLVEDYTFGCVRHFDDNNMTVIFVRSELSAKWKPDGGRNRNATRLWIEGYPAHAEDEIFTLDGAWEIGGLTDYDGKKIRILRPWQPKGQSSGT